MKTRLGDSFYLVPPAGTPITFKDIADIVKLRLKADSHPDGFGEMVKHSFNVKSCFFFNSGRAAMVSILKAMHKLSGFEKDEVVIPAYTCFSVAAAIVRSGLKIRLVDIDPLTMDYNYDKLTSSDFEKTLAVAGCNLFGILSDWDALAGIAKENNVFLIDDAAQSMGSYFKDKSSGSLGDAGFYSLGRGKNLSTISGGIIVTDNDEIASEISLKLEELKKSNSIYGAKILLELIFYAAFLRPELYWFPEKLPFLKLGETIYDENFSMSELSNLQKCTGSVLFQKLDEINAVRLRNGKTLAEIFLDDGRFQIPGYSPGACPIYLRLPVLARNRQERDLGISILKETGIQSSEMYPSTISDINGIEKHLANPGDEFSGARIVVDRLLTLPTHHYVKEKDIERIAGALNRI